MKRTLLRILPLYGVLPILCSELFNFIVYFGNRLITSGWKHYDLSLPLDGRIPFQSWAITIYVGSYLFWIVGFLLIARDERDVCYDVFSGELIGKAFCLLFFLLLPTMMTNRPDGAFELRTVFDRLTQTVYDLDPPDNLFPSIHCMESWIVARATFRCRKLRHPTIWRTVNTLSAFTIFASTLLVRQHVFLDVLGGVAVAEAGLWLAKKLRAGRIYPALERLLFAKRRNP